MKAAWFVLATGGVASADTVDIDFEADPRPIVMPAGAVDAHAALPFVAVPGGDTITFASAGFNYGIVDRAELGGDLLVRLDNGNERFATTVHGAFAAYHDGPLEIAAAAALGLAVRSTGATGTGETDVALLGGAWARYHLSQRLALFTGQPAVPIAGTTGGLPPLTYQLTIGLDANQPVTLALPVGASYQVGTRVYAFAAIELASLFLVNTPAMTSSLQLLFANFIPVGGGVLVSPSDDVDVGLEVADDLEDAGGRFVLQVFARLYVR